MTSHKGIFPILIPLHHFVGNGFRVSQFSLCCEKIRIHDPSPCFLIDCIKKLQNLSADKLIVAINDHKNLIGFTILKGCCPNVVKAALIF